MKFCYCLLKLPSKYYFLTSEIDFPVLQKVPGKCSFRRNNPKMTLQACRQKID